MKLFGFYITRNNWRHKFECADTRANRNAQEATQYRQSWQEARNELKKTNAQMEAARCTHKRDAENALAEITALNRIIKGKNDKIADIETARVIAEGRREELAEENRELQTKIEIAKEQHERQLNELRKERDGLKKLVKATEEVVKLLGTERDELMEKLKETSEQAKFFETKVAALQDYIDELEKANEGLQHELTATTGKIPNRDQVLHDQQQRISELEEACDKLIDENTEYSTKNENLRLQISTQKELLVELQMELDTYKERHEHKKELKTARQQRYRVNKRAKNIEQELIKNGKS